MEKGKSDSWVMTKVNGLENVSKNKGNIKIKNNMNTKRRGN